MGKSAEFKHINKQKKRY